MRSNSCHIHFKDVEIQNIFLLTELSFPDQSDSDSEDDIAGSLVTKETTEMFHSMAEIASCSYEARKVGLP